MSRVEEIVAEQLAKQPTEVIPNGHRYRLASGITELTFRPVVGGPKSSDVSHIATVETHFVDEDMPDYSQAELARLNRRSAFGSFYRANDGVRSKASYSISRNEPNQEWVAFILLIAFISPRNPKVGNGFAAYYDWHSASSGRCRLSWYDRVAYRSSTRAHCRVVRVSQRTGTHTGRLPAKARSLGFAGVCQ